jgi:hypothetical protein
MRFGRRRRLHARHPIVPDEQSTASLVRTGTAADADFTLTRTRRAPVDVVCLDFVARGATDRRPTPGL